MRFYCKECERVLNEEELKTWVESHGEQFTGCPYCLGGVVEAKKCDYCEEYVPKDELRDGVCNSCIVKHSKDFQSCYKVSLKYEEVEIKLNPLLVSFFSEAEINDILYNSLKKEGFLKEIGELICESFITNDVKAFFETLNEI